MHYRTLGLLLVALTFASLTTAQIQNGDFASSDGWSKFVDRIDSCEPDSACTTTDAMAVQEIDGRLALDTGDTGFCGVAGFRQVVAVPANASTLSFEARAYKDPWGMNYPSGVRINGEFVKKFNTDDAVSKTWDWQTYTVDVSSYAGQTVNLSLVIGDKSDRYCDMGDHSKYLYVDNMAFGGATGSTAPDSIDVTFHPSTVSPGDLYNMTFETTRDGERVTATVNTSIVVDGTVQESSTAELTDGFQTTAGEFPGPEDVSYFTEGTWKLVATTEGENGTIRDTATFEVVANTTDDTTYDLASIPEVYGSGDIVVYGESMQNRSKQAAHDIATALDAELFTATSVLNMSSTEYETDDFVLVGGPAVNGLVQDLAEQGKTLTPSAWRNDHMGESMLHLVDTGNADQQVTVVAGYDTEETAAAANYFIEAFNGRHQDALEGKRQLFISTASYPRTDVSITAMGGAGEDVDPGESIPVTVAVRNEGSTVFDGGLEFKKTVEGFGSGAAASTTRQRRIELEPGVAERYTFSVDAARAGTYRVTAGLYDGRDRLDSRELAFTVGARKQPSTIEVEMRPDTLSPGDRFNLTVRPLDASGDVMTGVDGRVMIYVNGELVDNSTSPLESESGEEFPSEEDFDGFDYGTWRLVAAAGGVQGSTMFNVVRDDAKGQTRTIRLQPGWNMVSTMSTVWLGQITDDCSIDTYQGAKVWTFGGDWTHPTVLQPTRSYYLHTGQQCVATVNPGDTGQATPSSIELEAGWNMISLPAGTRASLGEITGSCDVNAYRGSPVWSYDPVSGWQQLGRRDRLRPTAGYFVNVDAACSLSLGVSTPPTPGEPEDDEAAVPPAGEWKYEPASTCKFRGKGSGYRCNSDVAFDEDGGYWCECVNLTWVRYH